MQIPRWLLAPAIKEAMRSPLQETRCPGLFFFFPSASFSSGPIPLSCGSDGLRVPGIVVTRDLCCGLGPMRGRFRFLKADSFSLSLDHYAWKVVNLPRSFLVLQWLVYNLMAACQFDENKRARAFWRIFFDDWCRTIYP